MSIGCRERGRGLTLIELCVVLAVVSVLAALLLAAVAASREASRRLACLNNLKQVGLALHNYSSSVGCLPSAYSTGLADRVDETGMCWGWGAAILPQLEQPSLYNAINFGSEISDSASLTSRSTFLGGYFCPSNDPPRPVAIEDQNSSFAIVADLAPSHYTASAGRRRNSRSPVNTTRSVTTRTGEFDGAMYRNSAVRMADFIDGASCTFLVGERSPGYSDAVWAGTMPIGVGETCSRQPAGPAVCVNTNVLVLSHAGVILSSSGLDQPNSAASAVDGFSSKHRGGANFLFGDGSARFVRDSIDGKVFSALATRANGEVVSGDAY